MIDLDELRSVQSRERQTDSLQQLRETFYQDAGEFIQQLHRERERAAGEADDPWDSPEVNRLSDDINTAEQTVEAIYERRVGKIVKMASLAAAEMPTEDEGLTAEERDLFETLVAAIEQNRKSVEAVIDGEDPAHEAVDAGPLSEAPTDTSSAAKEEDDDARAEVPTDPAALEDEGAPTPPPEPTEPTDASADPPAESSGAPPTGTDEAGPESGVDAANLMGGDGPETENRDDEGTHTDGTDRDSANGDDDAATDDSPQADGGTGTVGSVESAGSADGDGEATSASVDRTTVRITSDVGEIFGVDQRSYDLSKEDVVTLPEANAGPLVERDAAERLD